MKRFRSPTKQKILLLLEAGLALSLRRSTLKQQAYVFRQLGREWKKINRQYLYRCLREFREERLVDYRENPDGNIKIILSAEGEKRSLQFKIEKLSIPRPASWDGRWRVVLYDIPESKKVGRDTLRDKLKELGFYEWQKSVFVFPYHCRDEIDFIVEVYGLRWYVRYAEFTKPTNESELKLHFNL